ncbi:hypothetical protein BHE74_00012786 [Ensete ventricosum]|nr:hypothetical protein BHE74_00012786 [Ensete ventricosum]
MSFDLVLKPCCDGCGSTSDLYGSNCKHTTLCLSCGKTMAANRGRCHLCGAFITKLIRFAPCFSYVHLPLPHRLPLFATYLHATHQTLLISGLMSHNSKLLYRYNFSKVAQYKQLTLEEAEEKMNKRRHNATGYERWMMKAATNGAAAFGEVKKNEDASKGEADGSNRLKKGKSSDDGEHSDKGEENEDEEEARKNRLGPSKKGVDDDEEGAKGAEFDLDDDDVEKGGSQCYCCDDWEHEETFTDDDEAVGNDPEEREDLAPEIPAPPEIKQDDEEEDEEDGGLSKSGKELKKLLGRAAGLNESDGEEEDDDDDVSVYLAFHNL